MKAKQYTVEIICALLILLWIYAAISKLIPYRISYTQLSISPYIRDYAAVLVWLVPAVEIALCVLLLVPRWRRWGLVGSAVLLTVFTLYIVAVLTLREQPPCNCGGVISAMSWTQHIFFNLFFTAIAVLGYWFMTTKENNDIRRFAQTGEAENL